jgi:tryptophan 2,3-dioxygenase
MAEYSRNKELSEPVLPGTAATDYERYLRTDELLSLQKAPGELLHPDEICFQVVHQSTEVLLKGVLWELERVSEHMAAGESVEAARLLRRANMMLEFPIGLLHVLETLSPYDYHKIRAGLGHGSGLDSPGFLGLLHSGPRLAEVFYKQLERSRVTAEQMYRRRAELSGLHDLAECLLDFDERVQIFRYHHLKLAERIIGGGVIGTSGVPVELLRQRQEHVFFKQLWDVRNQITNIANAELEKPTTGHS